jgi:SAM-dependent methyltransferase
MKKLDLKSIEKYLECPICKSSLKFNENRLICFNKSCSKKFPIYNNIPILINEENSIFSISGFKSKKDTFFSKEKEGALYKILKIITPSIGNNIRAKENYHTLGKMLLKKNKNPRVLIIGGSIDGEGISELKKFSRIECIETDIAYGKNTKIILDSHNIPFKKNSFDAVVAQAVLEHVLDPNQCVKEIHRVLKEKGLVYSEIPFMQQVHGGRFDFTRYSYLGQIRLFRSFELIKSAPTCGPGMALSWAYVHFLLSFSSNKKYRLLILGFGSFTSFFLKYFDYYLIKKNSSYGAASVHYFLGEKSSNVLKDKDLLKLYKE